MLMSRLFARTLREAPAEAEQDSHRLLLRARLVEQLAAGIYSYLPLGLRVLKKIEQIVREEMDFAGGQEILMPALQPIDRCGVPALPVQADSGAIGGKDSQEFMLLTEIGEDELLICPSCGYAANSEKAEFRKPEVPQDAPLPLEEVSTPGQKTIDQLAAF